MKVPLFLSITWLANITYAFAGACFTYVAWYVCKEGIGFGSVPGFEIPGAIMCLGCYTAAVCMVTNNMPPKYRLLVSLISLSLSGFAVLDTTGLF